MLAAIAGACIGRVTLNRRAAILEYRIHGLDERAFERDYPFTISNQKLASRLRACAVSGSDVELTTCEPAALSIDNPARGDVTAVSSSGNFFLAPSARFFR
jgi:hypothetical protein